MWPSDSRISLAFDFRADRRKSRGPGLRTKTCLSILLPASHKRRIFIVLKHEIMKLEALAKEFREALAKYNSGMTIGAIEMPDLIAEIETLTQSESAFPFQGNGWNPKQCGLTKREWFAGMALQGLLSQRDGDPENNAKHQVHMAVFYADNLIEKLKQP
jgi:hypothetical protein